MNFKLEDLIDIPLLQDLQEKLNKVYSFPSAIIDNEGKVLTAVAWQDICTKFHRTNPECEKECIKSDQYILEHLHEAKPAVSYQCPHGLVDNATPIIIDGKHLGNFFTGQFFLEKPDLEFFKSQAKKYGFNEKAYLQAVEKVPIWTKEKLNLYLDFIKGFIEIIAGLGLKNLKEIETNKLLKEKEEKYQSILKTAMDGFWITDIKGNLLEVNDTYCKMSGYSEKELLTMSIADIEAIESEKETINHIKNITEKGEDRFETKHKRKDGSIFYVEIRVQFQSANNNRLVTFIHDITNRKIAEEKLQESQLKYQFIVENTNDILWTMNPDYTLDYVSPSVVRFLGYTQEEHLQHSLDDFLTPESAALIRNEFQTGMMHFHKKEYEKLRNHAEFEVEFIRKDKSKGFAFITMNLIRDDNYNIKKIRGNSTDITVKKQLEIKVIENEKKYSSLYKAIPVPTYTWKAIENDFVLIEFNDAASYITNGRISEYVGNKASIMYSDNCDIFDSLNKCFIEKSSVENEINYSFKTLKQNKYLNVKYAFVLPDLIIVHTEDITERKMAEEKLKASEEKYRKLVELSPDAVIIHVDGIIQFVNSSAVILFEAENKTDLIGKKVFDLVHPEYKKIVKQRIGNILEEDFKAPLIEEKLLTLKGNSFIAEVTTLPITINNNSGVQVVARDISDRKQIENKLKEIEELFSLFMKYSPVYTFIKEVTPSESRVLQASENFKNLVGIPGKEMIGKTMKEVFPPEFAAKITKDDWSVIENGLVFQEDEELNGRNYTSIKFPIKKDGKNLMAGFTIDITERVQTEKILHDIIDNNPLSIQIVDENGYTLRTNNAYFKIFGAVPPQEFSIFTDLEEKGLGKFISKAKAGEISHFPDICYDVHDVIPEVQSNPAWIKAVLFPIKDKLNKTNQYVFIHEDITGRITAEAKLREKDIEFRKLSANVPDLIFQFTRKPDGSYYVPIASAGIINIFGCLPEDVYDDFSPIAKVIHPEDAERVINDIEYSAKNLSYFTCEFRVQIPGREIQWIYSRSNPEKLPDGSITWYGFNVDITIIKKAEKELYEKTLELNNYFTHSLDLFCIADTDGYFRRLNNAWESTLGYTIEELEGKRFLDFVHPDDLEATLNAISNLESQMEVLHFVNRYRTKDNSYRWIEWQSYPSGKTIFAAARDITEQKLRNEKILESEKLLNDSQQLSKIGSWSFDLDTQKVFWSNELFRMNKRDLYKQTPDFSELPNYYTKDSWEKLSDAIKKAIDSGIPYEFEMEIIREDGSSYISYTKGTVLKDETGNTIKLYGTVQDITERKKLENELILAKERAEISEFKLIEAQKTAHIGHWDWDLITEKLIWSEEIFNIFGVTKENFAVSSENFEKMIHPEDLDNFLKVRNEKLSKGEEINISHRIIRPNDEIRYVQERSKIIRNKKNEPISVFGTVQDITDLKIITDELKKAKERAEKNEQKLIDAQTVAKIGSWETNLITMDVVWSDETYKIFGLNKDQFKNTHVSFLDYVHPDDIERIEDVFKKSLTSKDYNSVQHRIITPSGELKHVEERWITFHDGNNKPIISFGTCQDITENKIIQSQLKKAKEKAEESDRLKSAFLANMSHEIRTPMNGILGFADLLKSPELSGEKQQEFIKIIEQSGMRMLDIINDIINISKVDSGLMDVIVSETNINKQIDYIFSFFAPEVKQKGLTFLKKLSLPNHEVNILTDFQKFNSILTNLVKNAIKFTSTGSIEIGYEKKDKFLEFYIKDTGIGIPANQTELIFERFRQGSEQLNRKYEGSGLGLSISKAYVEMMGGKIWVESEHHKGSVFYFTLLYNPVLNEEVNSVLTPSSAKEKEKEIKKLKVLIVEDDEVSMSLNKLTIESDCREMLTATTGTETVTISKNNPDIDLILMDIKLPEMDGYEATRKIREFNKKVVIIAQTAFALTGDREKALDAGCNDYLTKPYNKARLAEKINKFFKK